MAVIGELIDRGLQPEVSLIGPSAGVDQIMTVVSALQGPGSPPVRVAFVAPIAGAFHPTVFPSAAKVFLAHGTQVLVHSHKRDRHCPWEKAKHFWEKLRDDMGAAREGGDCKGGVYIHLMDLTERSLIDANFHNITNFLCASAEFWVELTRTHKPGTSAAFLERCVLF